MCVSQQLRDYFESTIGSLESYDKETGTELLKTMQELIACLGNKSRTAEKLYIHRNTLRYRIRKIEELTGIILSNKDTLIRLARILKIQPFL